MTRRSASSITFSPRLRKGCAGSPPASLRIQMNAAANSATTTANVTCPDTDAYGLT